MSSHIYTLTPFASVLLNKTRRAKFLLGIVLRAACYRCKYRGQFYCNANTWGEARVARKNIVAFFTTADPNAENFYENYCGKKIRIWKGDVSFRATIRDTCADSDCDGCCSVNASAEGYLVDIELQTVLRKFGSTEAYDNLGDELTFEILD